MTIYTGRGWRWRLRWPQGNVIVLCTARRSLTAIEQDVSDVLMFFLIHGVFVSQYIPGKTRSGKQTTPGWLKKIFGSEEDKAEGSG